jgi:mannitol-1-/sugar-/sorbitol-6-phosphatase
MKPLSAQLSGRVVLFDMDGVLVDSGEHIIVAWQRFADQHGVDLAELLKASHGQRTIDTLQRVTPFLDCEAEALRLEQQEIELARELGACPGAAALFSQIPRERLAIVTSASRPLALARLNGARFPVPAVVVTSELVSAGKPDPEGYLNAAAQLGVDPREALVIEDAPAGVAAARAAGMRVLAVTTTHGADELAEADLVAPSLERVAAHLYDGLIQLSLG